MKYKFGLVAVIWHGLLLAAAQPQPSHVSEQASFSVALLGVVAVGESLPAMLVSRAGLSNTPSSQLPEKLYFSTKGKTEVAVLDFCCGAEKYLVQRITVLPMDVVKQAVYDTMQPRFETNTGIHLGMPPEALRERLGSPDIEYVSPDAQQKIRTFAADCPQGERLHRLLVYKSSNPTHPMLVQHDMPSYMQAYAFVDSRLVCMTFGFEYP